MSVEDYSIECKAALNAATIAWLHEAAGEIQSVTIRNSRVDTGETKNSYKYIVDESSGEAQVGSPEKNAIWEEFGTGQYALEGKGRIGGWYVPEEKLTEKAKKKMKKVYGKDGKVFYYTEGKKPNRPLFRAFKSSKSKLQKRLEEILKGLDE